MPSFVITAVNERGQRLQQTETADSEREVRDRMLSQGYLVQSVRAQHSLGGERRRGRVKLDKFLVYNQQFLTLVKAGLPIVRALELLRTRARDERLEAMLGRVHERVKAGDLLSRAWAQEPSVPEIYTTTLMAGERSGNLEEVLARYLQYQRLSLGLRRKLTSSLIYPAVMFVLVVVVLVFLVTYVVPQFAALYSSLNATLPTITIVVLHIGLAIQHYAGYIALGLLAAVLTVMYGGRRAGVARTLDGLALQMPLLGELYWKYQVAMLCRTLSTLMLGGLPVLQGLETALSALRSPKLREGLQETMKGVREGEPVSAGLARHKVVPRLAVEMIEVGEGTGAMPQMLASVADFFDEDLANAMTALLALIEPIILMVVGMVVALILISLYLPIFSLGARIQQ
ncbi:MAG: type II secretion system F family protein [Acidobacteria bacterium]|nr:MAG: type II secretion system F family protein [Acidobacteriota bacterium]